MGKKQINPTIEEHIWDQFQKAVGYGNASGKLEDMMRGYVNEYDMELSELQDEKASQEKKLDRVQAEIEERQKQADNIKDKIDLLEERIEEVKNEQERQDAIDDTEFWDDAVDKILDPRQDKPGSQLIKLWHRKYKNRYDDSITLEDFREQFQDEAADRGHETGVINEAVAPLIA